MKFKQYPVLVWFLDEDMQHSAAMLTNKHLVKTISGCLQCLLSARFYFIGFRSAKFYKYYFDKDHKAETMDKYFPLWPLKTKPSYQGYNSKEGKWCRKCLEHYTYIINFSTIAGGPDSSNEITIAPTVNDWTPVTADGISAN